MGKLDRRCLYCGMTAFASNMCGSCRDRYTRKRRGFGGYPSYDVKSEGNNNLAVTKYDTMRIE